jgi:hypothetical protein
MDLEENRERCSKYRADEEEMRLLVALNQYLDGFETQLAAQLPEADWPPVLIGGLQRSGTTLLYQLIARHCDVGYINNFLARLWNAPRTGILVRGRLLRSDGPAAGSLTSDYARTPGLDGPHEFGYFWTKWLRLDRVQTHLLSDQEAQEVDWPGLARCLRQMAGLFGKPLVLKNPIACWNALRLYSHLPNLCLVLVRRSPYYIVQSTYLARRNRYGDVRHWWSLKPPGYAEIQEDLNPICQVVRQVVESLAVLKELASSYPGPCITVDYQQIRNKPGEVLQAICSSCGLQLLQKVALPPVSELPDGDRCKVTPDEHRQILDALGEGQGLDGQGILE